MTLRPLTFNDYIGQERIKTQLRISIGANRKNGNALPHLLLYGNPGLGKTTLAKIIASEFGVGFHEIMASNMSSDSDVENVLAQLSDERHDVLFIDEIHRLPLKIEELLYPVMEDFQFETSNGGCGGKSNERLWVPKFTLIGATTIAGDLSRPLRDRFGLHFQLQNYQIDEIVSILEKLSIREDTESEREALHEIARRAKGVARLAINYFYRCKEYADYIVQDGIVTSEVATDQFSLMGIDEIGLDENDYRVLEYMATQTRPVGIAALASAVDIDQPTIVNIIEPYLVQTRMINRTRSGREITERGLNWIGESDNSIEYSTTSNQSAARRVGQR